MEQIIQGDCLDVLKELPDCSVDSVVTDPPYGLSKEPNIYEVLTKWMNGEDYHHRGGGFMGKSWDSFVPGPSIWREVFRVLKPGGHALVFAGTRTQDLMTISLRLAGFEIRDVIEYLYFSGFPKSMDVGKQFDKRAGAEREVIGESVYAKRRPNGITGILRFDGFATLEELKAAAERGEKCPNGRDARTTLKRYEEGKEKTAIITAPATDLAKKWDGWHSALKPAHEPIILCRKPLEGTICDNVERYGTGALNIDGCRIKMSEEDFKEVRAKNGKTSLGKEIKNDVYGKGWIRGEHGNPKGRFPANCITTEPDAFYSKYFNVTPQELCKKASKKDRLSTWDGRQVEANKHPTVKPVELMTWLCRLITPPGGVILDPFAGSGSTLVAAKREGFSFIGIEKEAEYIEIVKARVAL